jgi:hypothetical protein
MLETILQTILGFWQFDMWVYSQWWTYAFLLIPAIFYTIFFVLKWTIITLPLWLPFYIIFSNSAIVKINYKDKEK